jgi:hypothetical protein
MPTVTIAATCYQCRGKGWMLWREGTSDLELGLDPGHRSRQKRAGNFFIPRPGWYRQSEWIPGSGKRSDWRTDATKDCFTCKGNGKLPQKAELYEG